MIDLSLWRMPPAADFANVNPLGRRLNVSEHFRVDNIDRFAGRISGDLVENLRELYLVFLASDVADPSQRANGDLFL